MLPVQPVNRVRQFGVGDTSTWLRIDGNEYVGWTESVGGETWMLVVGLNAGGAAEVALLPAWVKTN